MQLKMIKMPKILRFWDIFFTVLALDLRSLSEWSGDECGEVGSEQRACEIWKPPAWSCHSSTLRITSLVFESNWAEKYLMTLSTSCQSLRTFYCRSLPWNISHPLDFKNSCCSWLFFSRYLFNWAKLTPQRWRCCVAHLPFIYMMSRVKGDDISWAKRQAWGSKSKPDF